MNDKQGVNTGIMPAAPVYFLQASHSPEPAQANLLEAWQVLLSFKWLILIITLLTTCGAAWYAWTTPPLFRAEVTLAPVSGEENTRLSALAGQLGGLASLAGVNVSGGGSAGDAAIAVLKSRAFTDAFIQDMNLLPVLFSEFWDPVGKRWIVDSPEDQPTLRSAYSLFDKKIRSVNQDKKTGLTTLVIEWRDPEQAAQWANALVERLNRRAKREAIAEAEKSIGYLQKQLALNSVLEMRQAIYRLIEAQTKNIMLANVRDQFAFKVIDPAVVPEERSKPDRKFILALGTACGFMLGVVLAFTTSALRKRRAEA